MTILAIESAAKTASVCVFRDGAVLAEYTTNLKMTHSQTLLPMIREILDRMEMKPSDMDYIAVSTGPGSYTGLRIGVATAKGLALGAFPDDPQLKGLPCVSVSSLEALAYNQGEATDVIICPVMDARRRRVYCGLYSLEEKKQPSAEEPGAQDTYTEAKAVMEDTVLECDELVRILKEKGTPVIFTGDGTEAVMESVKAAGQTDIFKAVPFFLNTARASGVAAAAAAKIRRGDVTDADDLLPEYLCQSQAERERFRVMRPDDAEEVAKIEAVSITPPWSVKAFTDALENETAFFAVCESGGAIKGYAGMYMAADEAEITNVAVREDSRRGGVGSGIVGFLIKEGRSRGINKFFLEVRKGNSAAVALYEKCGFVKAGERKDFYSAPKEDAVLMELR